MAGHVRILVLLVGVVTLTQGHPQCLDFRAPFQPDTALTFCSEYSDLGCCGQTSDNKLREEYEYIQSQATDADWDRCQGYVKQLLCQKCSPYAAHIYDAEESEKARTFPGLCTNYCYDVYDKCKNMMWFLDPGLASSQVISTRNSFCQRVALRDVDYCYPELKTNPVLNRNLSAPPVISATPGCLCLEVLKNNLANPLWAGHAGDGSGRLFVAEQKGRVRIYNTRRRSWNFGCFLDFTNRADVSSRPWDERGFLGMAFHPNYTTNGRFFVYYSTRSEPGDVVPPELEGRADSFDSKIRISEVRVSDDNPDKADPNSERVLLEVLQPYQNHNGGQLMFGVDGYLYAFVGDGGGGGDPMDAGQDKTLLHGKVLRLDVDSDPSQPYTIPPDNPFVGEPNSKPEIYAYGIRNIWRCDVDEGDRVTGESRGRILCGDVGQNAYEEIDVLKKGANYGWNAREGFECYDNDLCGNIGPEELPIHAYDHSIGKSVTGGVFYRGCENPALNGQYIYGDFSSSRLFSLTESGGVWTNSDVNLCGNTMCQGDLVGTMNDFILSFGKDEDGEIYMLTSRSSGSSSCDGKLYKIVDPATRNDPSSCSTDATLTDRVPLPQRRAVWEGDKTPNVSPVATITIKIRTRSSKSSTTRTSSLSRVRIFRRNTRRSPLTQEQRRRRRRRRRQRKKNNERYRNQHYKTQPSSSPSSAQRYPYTARNRNFASARSLRQNDGLLRKERQLSDSETFANGGAPIFPTGTSSDLQETSSSTSFNRRRSRNRNRSNRKGKNRWRVSETSDDSCGACEA